MNNLVRQYQSRVIGPTEIIDHSAVVAQAYPPQAIATEPFIGFKILCRDAATLSTTPAMRLKQLDMSLGFLRGKGCFLRETATSMLDGVWVVSFPSPRSTITTVLNNIMDVLAILERHMGIVRQGLYEINVSGRCTPAETEQCLSSLSFPSRYAKALITPSNTPYKYGHIIRINESYMMLRTRWELPMPVPFTNHYDDLMIISQIIASMYH